MTDRRRNGLILLLVAGLLAASLIVIAVKPTRLGLDLKGGVELVYQGEPTQQVPVVTPEALDRALDIIRSRVDQLGVGEPEIQRSGQDQISVGLPDVQNIRRAQEQVGTPAQLYFYDWERNVLTPDGRTAAPLLPAQDPDAQRLSQAAGDPSQGQPLYDAVKLASRQRATANTRNGSRLGSAYYLFDRDHRYLAGPERSRADLLSALDRTTPAGRQRGDRGPAGLRRAAGGRGDRQRQSVDRRSDRPLLRAARPGGARGQGHQGSAAGLQPARTAPTSSSDSRVPARRRSTTSRARSRSAARR